MSQLYTQKLLLLEYEKRKNRNPQYSLRAFARDMGLPRTTVIDVISGKRKLSNLNIEKLTAKLKLDKAEVETIKSESQKTWSQIKNDLQRKTLTEDEFAAIYWWQYYAILNLANIKGNKSSPKWIADRLGITPEEAKKSLTVLKKLGLLKTEDGRLLRTSVSVQTTRDIPSRHIREQHRQFLYLAEESLENVDITLRDLSSVTVAIETSKIPIAKQMLLDFRRKAVAALTSENADTVYTLSTLLFPTKTYRNK